MKYRIWIPKIIWWILSALMKRCKNCNGTGRLRYKTATPIYGNKAVVYKVDDKGRGHFIEVGGSLGNIGKCYFCNGTGRHHNWWKFWRPK